MKSKTTWIWFALAAMLFAFIFVFKYLQRSQVSPSSSVLPSLKAATVTKVRILPANAFEITVENKTSTWMLTKPISYPAQTAAVQSLLDELQKLTYATIISGKELREHKGSEADFGFENPQFSIALESADNHWEIHVGKKTPPGDQVYVRVIGIDGVFVTDASWLNFIPRSAMNWRDTALVKAGEKNFDTIILSNNIKGLVVELRRNPTNLLWRMNRPLQSRADSERITAALQQLQAARVTQFVADDANATAATFGLQPAELDLLLGVETNLSSGIRLGKALTNNPAQVYAKRKGYSAIVTTAKESLASWYGGVNSFRDPKLLEFTVMPAEIEVHGDANFILQRQGSNDWKVAGEKFPADYESILMMLKTLAHIRVSDFVKDVVTAPDLQAYGLDKPSKEIIIRNVVGDTNAAAVDISFSATTNGIFVKRADEDFVYAISEEDYNTLFAPGSLLDNGWSFRDRHIWHFSEKDVAQITLRQNGKTRVLVHTAQNQWSLGPGSQGIINPPAIEETTHRLGELSAYGWAGRNVTNTEPYGFNTNNLQIVIELKSGEKLPLDFGMEISGRLPTALAATMLDGERWVFIFPPTLFQFVATYLTIPANAP